MGERRSAGQRERRTRFASAAAAAAFADAHGLRSVADVTAAWNAMSGGRPISRGRVQQILQAAEDKLRVGLAATAREMWTD